MTAGIINVDTFGMISDMTAGVTAVVKFGDTACSLGSVCSNAEAEADSVARSAA